MRGDAGDGIWGLSGFWAVDLIVVMDLGSSGDGWGWMEVVLIRDYESVRGNPAVRVVLFGGTGGLGVGAVPGGVTCDGVARHAVSGCPYFLPG
ncbi:hypothetical protein GCM10010435_19340 [Winogradskya consettensis]|uniref:Uncharacterized protein n=1 Tax=Winogradskya consettensis TaxID=113560 RepID=A0A919SVJ9_9ACTN|nr:hypothetical protein Aco04nite_59710 [Actinoplanes consettensis]